MGGGEGGVGGGATYALGALTQYDPTGEVMDVELSWSVGRA